MMTKIIERAEEPHVVGMFVTFANAATLRFRIKAAAAILEYDRAIARPFDPDHLRGLCAPLDCGSLHHRPNQRDQVSSAGMLEAVSLVTRSIELAEAIERAGDQIEGVGDNIIAGCARAILAELRVARDVLRGELSPSINDPDEPYAFVRADARTRLKVALAFTRTLIQQTADPAD